MKARLMLFCQLLLAGAFIFRVFPTLVLADQADLSGGSALSLDAALDRARTQNPQLAMARARVSEAEGMREQAGLIPNPSLYATSENTPLGGSQPFRFSRDTDDYVYLNQKIELGGKRSRRVAYATENVGQMSLQSEVAMHQMSGKRF